MTRFGWLAALWLALFSPMAMALTVTDLAGRSVILPDRIERIVLGEGRMITALGILDPADPLGRLVGMMGDFAALDPASYGVWQQKFPALAAVRPVGKISPDSFSVEQTIALRPDLVIFGLAGHGPGVREKSVLDPLAAAGIPVLFVDFFLDPLVNVPRSLTLLGDALNRPQQAAAFTALYRQALAAVDDCVGTASHRPLVFLENRVGLQEDCCATVGAGVLGRFIERAGGRNLGSAIVPGLAGTISLEYLLTHQPDYYLGTAVGSPMTAASHPNRIILGPGVAADQATASLRRSLTRTGIADLAAVQANRAGALWHHFFHSPFNVVALQAMARQFQPQACAALDPDGLLTQFQRDFQPMPLPGRYWTALP